MTVNEIVRNCPVSKAESLTQIRPPPPTAVFIAKTSHNNSTDIGTEQNSAKEKEKVTKRLDGVTSNADSKSNSYISPDDEEDEDEDEDEPDKSFIKKIISYGVNKSHKPPPPSSTPFTARNFIASADTDIDSPRTHGNQYLIYPVAKLSITITKINSTYPPPCTKRWTNNLRTKPKPAI